MQCSKVTSGIQANWIYHYLNDFLTIPLVAIIGLHGVWFIKKDKTIRLNKFTILSLVIVFAVFFEYYLPKQSYRYTADIWDVFCYFIGGVVFYFLQKET
ncbi:hypothetical protein V0F38_02140 [Aequorivita sp. MCCC 1A16792]